MARDQALDLAREVMDTYKASNNEWRSENIDQRSLYITADKTQALLANEATLRYALEARVRILEQSVTEFEGKNKGSSTTIGFTIAAVTILISIIAIVINVLK